MSDVKTKRLPKYMQVLKALRAGMEVKLGNDSVPYVMYQNQIGVFGVRTNTKDNSREDIFLYCDLDLNCFIRLCNQISDDDITIMMAGVTLNKLKSTENKNEND